MWEWKLAVWWNRDNKGRAREKFANSKIEARSVEHGKLLPPSIFCYYQASGHRPIGSVANSWVEGLCFDLNYQWFKYLFWTGKDPRNLINKCSGFSTCIGWSSEGRLWMYYFYPKLEHRQQPIFQMLDVTTCNLQDGRDRDLMKFQVCTCSTFLSCWFSCFQNIARILLSWDGSWWDFALLPRRPLLQIPHVFFWRLFSRAGNIRLV